jgi:hypothetical protein
MDGKKKTHMLASVYIVAAYLLDEDNVCFVSLQALLHSVPIGKMMVLDLFADVKPIWKMSSQFYGVPYIWSLSLSLSLSQDFIVSTKLSN